MRRLRLRAFPFHSSVPSFIAEHDFIYVVEQNRDSQLRSLIVNELSIDPVRLVPIVHYDGTPITARFIAKAIGDHLDQLKVTPLRKVVSCPVPLLSSSAKADDPVTEGIGAFA